MQTRCELDHIGNEDLTPFHDLGVEPKIGVKPPKMDGENNGSNPIKILKWMIWGGPLFLETPTSFYLETSFEIPGSPADQTKWLIFRIPDPTNGQSLVFGLPGKCRTFEKIHLAKTSH